MHEIVLSGPGKNALSTAMMEHLLDELERAGGRPVLLTGSNGAFSAGLDLKEVVRLERQEMERFLEVLDRLMARLYTYPGPTVAAVNGHAIAGGAILALCCDHRVGAPDPGIKIGLNEVALGLHFPPRILAICRARIPAALQETVLLGAALHPPDRALTLGLLDEIAEDVKETAVRRLEALAAHPAHAYGATKRSLREATVAIPEEVAASALRQAVPHWTSPELKARLTGMLKR